MKAKKVEQEKARKLRKQGTSIVEIERQLGVPRSSVHSWVKDIKLTKRQKRELEQNSRATLVKGSLRKRRERLERRASFMEEGERLIGSVSDRDLLIMGAALYWGEGHKSQKQVRLSNSDPGIINVFVRWLIECFDVNIAKLTVRLHIPEGFDEDEEKEFWITETGIAKDQFGKTTFAKNASPNKKIKADYHGVLHVDVYDTNLFYKIEGMLEALGKKR